MHAFRSWRRVAAAALLLGAALLGGCATGPRTTVILLPDEDGHVGAVTVADAAHPSQPHRLQDAFASVSVAPRAAPSAPQPLGSARVGADYAALLAAQPLRPVNFILYFQLDSTALTESSRAQLPAVVEALRERRPTEVTVFGHADASGTEQRNLKLSAERADLVATLLRRADPTLAHVDVQSFGDRVPLVAPPSGDVHAVEPRNRRAEIQIL